MEKHFPRVAHIRTRKQETGGEKRWKNEKLRKFDGRDEQEIMLSGSMAQNYPASCNH